jgi:tetratricopeptide (TPR) repeat protein
MKMLRATTAAAMLAAAGCATAISGSADNITRLEQARVADPKSEQIQRSLGIAYFKANRLADARATLQRAVAMAPTDGMSSLYLGLTAEAQNDLPSARSAYEAYLRVGRTRGVKNQIAERLSLISRKEHETAAKEAIAQEQRLSSVPGTPRTVAVMPFVFSGSDTSLKPIERGFAELVATDLSRSAQLTVVERDRLQALLEEMKLHESGIAAGSGVRVGKILQAGRLVGGNITQLGTDQLRASAFVTNVQSAQPEGAGANDQQAIDQVFNLEKNLVLRLFADMNVVLTTAERNAIEQRPTRSLAAFLAFSRGLEAEDRGRFDDAARFFDNAVRLDPNFRPAQQRSQDMRSVVAGSQVTTSSIESGLRGTSEGQAAVGSSQGATSVGNTAMSTADGLNPSVSGAATGGGGTSTQPIKDASSGTGGDNVATKSAKVTIVIHQPKP